MLFSWPIKTYPIIRTAGRFPLEDRGFSHVYGGPGTRHHSLHIYGYHGQIQIGNTTRSISPGDMTFSPAGVATRYDLPQPGHHYCLHFEEPEPDSEKKPCAGKNSSQEKIELPLHISLGAWRELAEQKLMWIARLHAMAVRAPLAGHAAGAAMQEFLLWLALLPLHQEGEKHARVGAAIEAAVDYIEQNLARQWTVPQLAKHVGLSQNYLARKFRERVGVTLPRYVLTRRIEYARSLLVTTGLPVGTIARRSGLPDPQYFNKQFRRLTGMSPSAVRADLVHRAG